MYKEITVPADGVSKQIPLTGKSVIVVSAPAYPSISDAPLLSFDDPGDSLPALIRSVYSFPGPDCFEKVIITGTAESAGDSIILLGTNACLPSQININVNDTLSPSNINTIPLPMDDTVQSINSASLLNNGQAPRSVFLSAYGGDGIRYMWNSGGGTNPANGVGYLLAEDAEPVEIIGVDIILNMRFINDTNGQTPVLAITPIY